MEKDYLTGALTRRGLFEWYDGLASDSVLQFMLLDLDNFKAVNDTYGHNVGDKLLIAVVDILSGVLDGAECVRLGGDEFVLAFLGRAEREKITGAAADIIKKIKKKEGFEYILTDLSASIGIALNNEKCPLNDILFKIDTAMYAAKEAGKARFVVFNDIEQDVYEDIRMEQHQAQALKNDEFEIYYKPIINSQTSKLVLSQAVLVWNMPDGTVKRQDEFTPLFEKNGFIRELNMWTLEKLCEHMETFHSTEFVTGRVGMRISKLFLGEHDLKERLEDVMEKHGVDKSELCFEIEEKAFSSRDDEIVSPLENLWENGFQIAVINVGAAFTSLKYWDRLNLSYIMFDTEYLKSAMATPRGRMIIKTLISIGYDLRIRVMADGIELKDDVMFLGGCGCTAIGGPFYSQELPMAQYREFVKGKLVVDRQKIEFRFKDDFNSSDGKYEGSPIGDVYLRDGISDDWGSVYFPGGSVMRNVLQIPAAILAESSYTIGMWLKPEQKYSWTSALYARYMGGFMSFVPFELGGTSVFRISEDADLNGWHDIMSRPVNMEKWSFVCITYDDGVSRYYLNGRKCGYQADIPLLPTCKQILVGGDPFQGSYCGYISALTFFDVAMSEDEVREWYEGFLSESGFNGEEEKFWMEAENV